jgi:hypothetical protein
MRKINEIARDINNDWKKVSVYAEPYLKAMLDIESINDMYGQDTASSVVRYFLSNAQYYRGVKAKELKKELNDILN